MQLNALGSGIRARRLLAPGEELLWATSAGKQLFDVRGLDPDGTPQAGMLSRAGLGAVGVAAEFALTAATGGGNDASGGPQLPDVMVMGNTPNDLAVAHGFQFRESAMWALTTWRLFRAVSVQQTQPAPPPKKKGFLSGVVEVGRIVADVISSPTTNAGKETVDGDSVIIAEFPRAQIRGITLTDRQTSHGLRPALRVGLADGSGFDFLLGSKVTRAQFERMLALSHGAPE
ncbi:hypothetical protein SAMN05192558_109340 [Actinokineospora alba]|uniref:Uncharacterized protein n=1 Tax=Actinokineospora alba TaxID=504798 RepID=A0A1H0TAB6_9PSEU|nr:hypothetical protein [Actinokineospora alba]TDP66300.1 hypothetical protein C8E96_1800 [Actinokineospora alba]SDJ21418.1 hypothetical protein SAMN05421871_11135 [Actinokineospora alba]SDP50558.1 hypothetical protein SAMN05192558_109340 [Actinokineospora alba]